MKTNTITAVPRLRFPEFQEDKSWQAKPLIECASFINKKIELSSLNLTNYISTENILSDFGGVAKASKLPKTGKATHFIEEDILISNIRPYLRKVWFSNFIGGASNDVLVVRAKKEVNSKYLSSYLMTDRFINYVMTGAKGVKMPRGDISQIKKYDITYPSIEEQQKIADCLSSLDESIDAEIQQLNTLKDHKAGLLQNLFPVAEETVPKYRFAEFEGDGNWESFYLTDIADNLDSKRVPITSKDRLKGQIPYYGASGIIDYVQNYIFDDDLLCVSEDGANLIDRVYPIAFSVSGKSWINNHAHVLKFNNMFTQVLVQSYLNSISLEQYLTGVAQPKLNKAKLNSISIPLPRVEEQKKIAECLSSLDNFIQAKDEEIKTLKEHKQGLMQQLFPVMGDK